MEKLDEMHKKKNVVMTRCLAVLECFLLSFRPGSFFAPCSTGAELNIKEPVSYQPVVLGVYFYFFVIIVFFSV